MDKKIDTGETEIDLLHLLSVLLKRSWIIIICVILVGAIGFCYSAFFIPAKYQARALMYVNNSSISIGSTSFSISSSEISAARSLLSLYVVILKSRTTLERVIAESGVSYTTDQLSSMISANSVSNTEVFEIVCTSTDPEEARLIVNTITEVLPDRIYEIVNGSSVRVVDDAVTPKRKSSPSNVRNAGIGMLIGFVLSAGAIIVLDLLDNSIRDENYLLETYDIPVLAAVPDMDSKKSGGYYKDYAAKPNKNVKA